MEALQVVFIALFFITVIWYLITRIAAASHTRAFRKNAKPVRKLTAAERAIAEVQYSVRLRNDNVYELDGEARVETLHANHTDERHLLINGVEIRFFPHWEQLLTTRNKLLVAIPARGAAMLLPIEVNDVGIERIIHDNAAGRSQSGIIGHRDETEAEALLRAQHASNNVGQIILLGFCLLGILLASRSTGDGVWWGMPFATLGLWTIFRLIRQWRRKPGRACGTFYQLRGTLRHDDKKMPFPHSIHYVPVLVDDIRVYYPKQWMPHITLDDGLLHDVEIDVKHFVTRHDGLSALAERQRFPIVRWGRYLAVLVVACILMIAGWGFNRSPISTLHMAIRQITGGARILEPSTTPTQLLAQNPEIGDWVNVAGTVTCLDPSRRHDPVIDIDRGERLQCELVGWNNQQADIGLPTLSQAERDLVGLWQQMDSDSQLFIKRYPSDFAAVAPDEPGSFLIRHVNRLVRDIGDVCDNGGLECEDVRQWFLDHALKAASWQAALDAARNDRLPKQVTVTRKPLQRLSYMLQEMIQDDIRYAALHKQYSAELAKRNMPVYLRNYRTTFEFVPRQYGGSGPLKRHIVSLVGGGYGESARIARLRRLADLRGSVTRTTPQKLFNIDFDFKGRIRDTSTYRGHPVFTLQYDPTPEPRNLFHDATPPLYVLVMLIAILFAGFELMRHLRHRQQRRLAVDSYVKQIL